MRWTVRTMMLMIAVGFLPAVTTAARGQSISFYPPQAFVYRGVFGGETNYIVVPYQVSNKGSTIETNTWGIVLQTSDGRQLDDGLHPMVKARYCQEHSSYCRG